MEAVTSGRLWASWRRNLATRKENEKARKRTGQLVPNG